MSTRGERLRGYFVSRMGSRRGWMAELVRRSGVKRQTLSKWTAADFDGYPDLETLALVAKAMGVSLSEVVAAMEDEQVVALGDARLEAAVDELVARALAARGVTSRQPPGART